MIDVLTNGLLSVPYATALSLNYCSHDCSYCYANVNNPFRKADVNGIMSQLKNYKHRENDLVSYYLREKYPVLISSNVDPFAKSNYRLFEQISDFLLSEEIPMFIATRGGYGWKEFAERSPKQVWFVSVPYSDDNIREKLEPNAPSLDERFEMVKALKHLGHEVIIGITPLEEKWTPYPLEIVRKYESIGVTTFKVSGLHLSPKQQINLSAKKRDVITEDILTRLKTGGKVNTDWTDFSILEISEYCEENELILDGIELGLPTAKDIHFIETYDKLLPTKHDFFLWCYANKKQGDFIYFKDFFDFFAPKLPQIETNISKFLFNKAVLSDKSSYKKAPLTDLLHYLWEVKGVNIGLADLPVFSWAKQRTANKTDFVYDGEHNKVLIYHPEVFNLKDYTIFARA